MKPIHPKGNTKSCFVDSSDKPAFSNGSNYFAKRALNIKEMIALSKFYNHWSRYDLTNNYLLRKFYKGELNEDAVFLLLKTLNYYNKNGGINDHEKVFKKGLSLNQERWCEWVNDNVQLLRQRKLKRLFCERCE